MMTAIAGEIRPQHKFDNADMRDFRSSSPASFESQRLRGNFKLRI
jgi:hypothetical protein